MVVGTQHLAVCVCHQLCSSHWDLLGFQFQWKLLTGVSRPLQFQLLWSAAETEQTWSSWGPVTVQSLLLLSSVSVFFHDTYNSVFSSSVYRDTVKNDWESFVKDEEVKDVNQPPVKLISPPSCFHWSSFTCLYWIYKDCVHQSLSWSSGQSRSPTPHGPAAWWLVASHAAGLKPKGCRTILHSLSEFILLRPGAHRHQEREIKPEELCSCSSLWYVGSDWIKSHYSTNQRTVRGTNTGQRSWTHQLGSSLLSLLYFLFAALKRTCYSITEICLPAGPQQVSSLLLSDEEEQQHEKVAI